MFINTRQLVSPRLQWLISSYGTNLTLSGLLAAATLLCAPLTASALSLSPSALSFSSMQGGSAPANQTVTLWKGNDRTQTWAASTNAPWANVTPASGTLSTERDQTVVSVNPAGLSPGTYTTTLTIRIQGFKGRWNKTSIPLSLTVSSSGSASVSSIRLGSLALGFTGFAGGANPAAQLLTLTNPTGDTLSWSLSDTAAWLNLSTTSGTTTTETDSISVSVNLAGLATGTYTAVITITASGATNSPQTIPVSLTVATAPATPAAIGLSRTNLTYTGTVGGTNPASQSFTISNTGGSPLAWTASDNAAWLTLTPASGTNTGTVAATANLAGLAAGTYSGTITVAATGTTSKTLPVSFTITSGMSAATTASTATLNWVANTEMDLAGYKVYIGTQSGVYGAPIVLGKVTTYQAANLTIGTTYFFSITAYDGAGNESSHSPEVSKSIF